MKIAILGAGISGLSAAYFLEKASSDCMITVFESSDCVGGVMRSSTVDGAFFEHGPRTFSSTKAPDVLALINEVGLAKDLLFSSASVRYLLHNKQLRALPSSLPQLFFSPFGKGVVQGILSDLRHPKGIKEDESIYSFVKRHANEHVAEMLVEPLVLGIYGGDYKQLSVSACFPEWKEYEYKYGSLIKGMFKERLKDDVPPLFTLKGGIQSLPEKLASLLNGTLRLRTKVTSIEEVSNGVCINGEYFDHAICALPAPVVREIAPKKYAPFFDSFSHLTLSTVNAVVDKDLLPNDGFGYLVPSSENENILGVVFDSVVFPQSEDEKEGRVTVMMRGDKNTEERAVSALTRHLGMTKRPHIRMSHAYKQYLPQLPVGHLALVDRLQSDTISFIGNYIHGAAVNRCIKEAAKVAKRLAAQVMVNTH